VHDVRSLAPHERRQLEQAQKVATGAERATDVLDLQETRAGCAGGVAKRAASVSPHRHVEAVGERRQQGSDVRLRSSGFGERDKEQDSWTLGRRP
jgi:hypothetical protein